MTGRSHVLLLLDNNRILGDSGDVAADEYHKINDKSDWRTTMARTPGALNLTVREHGMKVVIATHKAAMAALKQENKALKEALKIAQKAAQKK